MRKVDVKAVIPVAGAGTRLQPHTFTAPKAMLPVGDKPILAHILTPLEKLQPEEVILITGFKGEMIREYVSQRYSFKATFVHQEELHGLGYAIHLAMDFAGDNPLLVILGDTIVECDLEAFCRAGDYVLGLRQVDDPCRFGIAEVAEEYVVGLEEKPSQPKSNLALIGLYYFQEAGMLGRTLRRLVDADRRTNGEIQLTDALHDMIEAGIRFVPFEVEDWYDCGKKETLLTSSRHLLSKLPPPEDIAGSVLVPPVHVAATAEVNSSILGPNVSVSENAVVEDSILRDCIIGEGAQVKRAILENSLVGARATIIGESRVVNVGDRSQLERD